jgi:alpha-beta hydrolase superfamily lysophospholipase
LAKKKNLNDLIPPFVHYRALPVGTSCFLTISLISIAFLLPVAPGPLSVGSQAEAFWPFNKKGNKGNKKRRQLRGTPVGLVPGNPPATYWAPKGKAKAVVLCLHELGLYSGVFDDLGSRLSANDIAVYAIDLRGFGGWKDVEKKEGKMDLPKTLADVKGSCEILHKLHPDLPVFVLGEAMGGALALQAATKFPDLIKGVISAAPGGEHYKTVNNYMSVAGSMAVGSKHAFGLGEELLDMATPKEELKEALQNDEMCRLDVTSGEMMACQFFMYKTQKMAKQIKETPVLIVHGQKDGESKLEGSQSVYDNLGTKDKKFAVVEDGDHYTFEDTKVSDKAFDTALTWIDQHIAQKSE